ncbi:MAG: VanW family protein [Polyangiales bacterium]
MTPSGRALRHVRMTRALRLFACLALLLPLAVYALVRGGIDLMGEVRVRGVAVTRDEAGVAAVRALAGRWRDEVIAIRLGPYGVRYTRAELGAQLPTDAVCARLSKLGRSGDFSTDLATLWRSRGAGIELGLAPAIDQALLSARISDLRHRLERPPVPAMILADGRTVNGIPGFTIDFADAIATMEQAIRGDLTSVTLKVRSVEPPNPVLYGNDGGRFARSMIGYETKYRTEGAAAGRAHNIEMAASKLENSVIEPGHELSFNEVVGERSYAQGFAGAKEIAYRRIVNGVGGGVCQVAATLHAAAFLGGFALTEYRPHSRPARYIDLGLDTMVSWPAQDMRIGNPYPFPVRVRARARDGVLQIWLEGSSKAYVVEWNTEVLSRAKAGMQQLRDDTLRAGESEVVQEAIDGVTIRRVRTIYLPNGPHREEATLRYPPNDQIVMVGEGTNLRGRSRARGAGGIDEPLARTAARLGSEDF